jgi:hypothetical protein
MDTTRLPRPESVDTAPSRPVGRGAPALSHYRRVHPVVVSGAAVLGALDICLEARRHARPLHGLFGLSIIASATPAQIDSAMTTTVARGVATRDELNLALGLSPPPTSNSLP